MDYCFLDMEPHFYGLLHPGLTRIIMDYCILDMEPHYHGLLLPRHGTTFWTTRVRA